LAITGVNSSQCYEFTLRCVGSLWPGLCDDFAVTNAPFTGSHFYRAAWNADAV